MLDFRNDPIDLQILPKVILNDDVQLGTDSYNKIAKVEKRKSKRKANQPRRRKKSNGYT